MTPVSPPRPAALQVEADLQISVDGVPARVVGSGQQLRVETDHPVALLRGVLASGATLPAGRQHLAQLVDAVAARGITVVAAGRRGPSIRLGAGVSSPLARRLLGTSHATVSIPESFVVTAGVLLAILIWRGQHRSR